MGKIWVEVTFISAYMLGHSSSLWKRQWFAVGWIDPDSKYCTKVDASGNENPVWRTKFAILVDSETSLQDLMLNVEVHSIDPIFLTEKIHGSATVIIREFLAKKISNSEVSLRPGNEEVRSYQLRKKDSGKPRGFIDMSIHIFEEKEKQNSNPGKRRGNAVLERGNNSHLSTENELGEAYLQNLPLASLHHQDNQVQTNDPSSYPMELPANNSDTNLHEGELSYERCRTPSPPPPPSNVGYIPTFLPKNDPLPSSSSSSSSGASPRENVPPGLTMGALAAGALIFGDDFMSGFDVPLGLADDSLTIPTGPPS